MQAAVPLACLLSVIHPPGVQYESALLQVAPVDKAKCPLLKDSSDVAFQLYTRHNPTVYQELRLDDDERLFASNMDFQAPTVLYFHAFMEQPDDGSGIMVREAYMQRGDSNVIMVAAPQLEAGPWYWTAAHNTWYIGRFAAHFIDYMVARGLQLNNTHLVGHSLGAQAAGVAGGALTTGRVARITGLDPALPLFATLPPPQRLDHTDAHFVDVIHTDAGIFGWKEPIGHADFFPNGGKSPQPGCELEVVIPQQLLLNKCAGSEHTRGFYSYYLQSNPGYQQDSREYSPANHVKQLLTASKRIQPELPTVMLISEQGKYLSMTQKRNEQGIEPVGLRNHDQKMYTDEDVQNSYDSKYITPNYNNLHKKRVTRNIQPMNTNSNDLSEKGERHSNTHPSTQDITVTSNNVLKRTSNDAAHSTTTNDPQTLDNDTTSDALHTRTHSDDSVTNEHIDDYNHDTRITEAARDNTLVTDNDHQKQTNKHEAEQIGGSGWLHAQQQASDDKTNRGKSNQCNTSTTTTNNGNKHTDRHANKRQKRFLQFFRSENDDNFVLRALDFLVKNRKSVVPIISVVRDITTLVKSGNGELSHASKETSNYVGIAPPPPPPPAYSLELGGDSKLAAFLKRLVGLTPRGDRLTVGSG